MATDLSWVILFHVKVKRVYQINQNNKAKVGDLHNFSHSRLSTIVGFWFTSPSLWIRPAPGNSNLDHHWGKWFNRFKSVCLFDMCFPNSDLGVEDVTQCRICLHFSTRLYFCNICCECVCVPKHHLNNTNSFLICLTLSVFHSTWIWELKPHCCCSDTDLFLWLLSAHVLPHCCQIRKSERDHPNFTDRSCVLTFCMFLWFW